MAYTCPTCKRTSHNPTDELRRYCGACHKFEDGSAAMSLQKLSEHLSLMVECLVLAPGRVEGLSMATAAAFGMAAAQVHIANGLLRLDIEDQAKP